MMNVDYKGVEAGSLAVPSSLSGTFVAGRPITMSSSGVATPSASTRVLGLIKENYISGVIDEFNKGGLGIYGAGVASALLQGIATVQQAVFNGTSYAVYDQTLTYHSGDVLFANPANGLLTNVAPAGCAPDGLTSCRVGMVLSAPSNAADGDPMQLVVNCGN